MYWMFKAAGAFLIFAVGTLLGLRKGQTYVRRAQMLTEMVALLRYLEKGIRFRRDTTQDLLRDALAACPLRTLPFTPNLQKNTVELPQALEEALNQLSAQTQTFLTGTDCHLFAEAMQQLGHGQAQEEMQKLAYAIAALEDARGKAVQEAAVQGKLYRTLGLSGGAAAAVLLL